VRGCCWRTGWGGGAREIAHAPTLEAALALALLAATPYARVAESDGLEAAQRAVAEVLLLGSAPHDGLAVGRRNEHRARARRMVRARQSRGPSARST
jgi:hypothetical protein